LDEFFWKLSGQVLRLIVAEPFAKCLKCGARGSQCSLC
jgi:hypothetical protein